MENRHIKSATEEYLGGGPEGQDHPQICDMGQDAIWFLFKELGILKAHEEGYVLSAEQEKELDDELLLVVAEWMDRNGILPDLEVKATLAAKAKAKAQAADDALAAREEAEEHDAYEEEFAEEGSA